MAEGKAGFMLFREQQVGENIQTFVYIFIVPKI